MVESRCGIVCSECEFRVSMNCKGCTCITKPFWGEDCKIKSCAESKQLKHCGECADDIFPCDQLLEFAYDKAQGDDGARINQCEMWRNEK
ncbi:DUF3795 domain-containing protein [Cellulosilyticum sp. I15G10I2]|uniref:DUF3795 domain-containing protein n=1 Tax=Cellulosilyticum sp. I15G10I2 TaxID=1892843 RepID=UPI00085C4272|nr:DUF3795 domain-containing protein [Cellulosilyticum sp. I15G10I2]